MVDVLASYVSSRHMYFNSCDVLWHMQSKSVVPAMLGGSLGMLKQHEIAISKYTLGVQVDH